MRFVVWVLVAMVVATSAAGCTAGDPAERATDGEVPRPRSMAALGDSITRAFAACGRSGDCVQTSWATGTARNLHSHGQRLDLDNPGSNHNLAVSGARVAGLASQTRAAIQARPDYVTVLIGANDACTGEETAMTSVGEYTDAFDAAMEALMRGLPNARILVLSIPDLARLWEIGKDRPEVRRVWEAYSICPSMLAEPTDISAAADARRERVRARIQAYNAAMAAACGRHPARCRHDQSAIFDYRYNLDEISDIDYWHPSRRGQAALSEIAWEAGFWS